ncbi:MAG: TSUP family transporter [Dermatophilaceae bacterium]
MPPSDVFAVLALAVVVGAVVQGGVGLGLGLVSAPVAVLVAPELMPGLVIWLSTAYPLLTLAREWREVDWGGLGWSFIGRVPATVAGGWITSVVSVAALGLLVGVVVLVAVVLTVRLVRVPIRPSTLAAAGVVSGVTGTTTSIGGPPLAVLYQHEAPDRIRGTLGAYFVAGGALSLVVLGVFGELDVRQLTTALALSPFLLLGLLLSGWVRRNLPADRVRAAVLVVCAASAAVLVVRSLV